MERIVIEEVCSVIKFLLVTDFILYAVGFLVMGEKGDCASLFNLLSLSGAVEDGTFRFFEVAISATISSVTVVIDPLNCPPPELTICLYLLSARFMNA